MRRLSGARAFLMGQSRRELAIRCSVMIVALVCVIASLEMIARLPHFDFRELFATHFREKWRQPSEIPDPELLHIHRPYLRFTAPLGGENIRIMWCLPRERKARHELQYDRHGFRNDREFNTADVTVIGDSFIEAAEVASSALFTTMLARLTGLTVVNFGQGYYGPQQELIVLRRYAIPLRPRIVVWTFFEGNDLDDFQRYEDTIRAPRHLPSIIDRSFTFNAAAALARLFSRGCGPSVVAERMRATVRSPGGLTTPMYFAVGIPSLSPKNLKLLDKTVDVLAQADALARRGGSKLVVAFVPTKFRTYRRVLEIPQESDLQEWSVNELPAILRTMLARRVPQAGYVDLTSPLRHAAEDGMQVYFPDDTHWSPEGHGVVAEAIAASVHRIVTDR